MAILKYQALKVVFVLVFPKLGPCHLSLSILVWGHSNSMCGQKLPIFYPRPLCSPLFVLVISPVLDARLPHPPAPFKIFFILTKKWQQKERFYAVDRLFHELNILTAQKRLEMQIWVWVHRQKVILGRKSVFLIGFSRRSKRIGPWPQFSPYEDGLPLIFKLSYCSVHRAPCS